MHPFGSAQLGRPLGRSGLTLAARHSTTRHRASGPIASRSECTADGTPRGWC